MSSDKLIIASLALLNAGMIPFLLNSNLGYLSYLLLFILLLSLGLFGRFLLKKSKPVSQGLLYRSDCLFLFVLLVLSFAVGFRYLNTFSLWLDEYEEGRNVLYFTDILQRAADYQQPPLGYYLRKIGLILFGQTESGLRSASLAGFTLNILAMYLTVKKITRNSLFSFFSAILLTFNIILISFSTEARPYSISLMYSSFLYYALADYLFPEQDKPGLPSYFLIFIIFFWLMSISLQPLFFVLLLFVFSFTIGVLRRRKNLLYLSAFSFAALVLFFPFALQILEKSTGYLNQELVMHKLNYGQWRSIAELFFRLFYKEFYKLVALQAAGLLILSLFFSKHKGSLFVFLVFAFSYVFSIYGFMILKVNWWPQDRYFATAVPLFYLIFFIAFHFLLDGRYLKIKNVCLAIMAVTIIFAYSKAEPFKSFYQDWRGLYSFLDETSAGKSKALVFAYPAKGNWVNDYFVATEYYPTDKVDIQSMRQFSYPSRTTYDDLYETINQNDKGEFFFVVMAGTLNPDTFEKIVIAGVEKFALRDFYVFHTQTGVSLKSTAKQFFDQVNLADPQVVKYVRTYDGLFLISLAENNCKDASKYLEMWKPLAEVFDEKLITRIRHHNQLFAEKCP